HSTHREGEVSAEHVVSIPFARGVARVALVEPARRQVAEKLGEREMRQLMANYFHRVTRVGAGRAALHHDAMRLGKGDGGAPFGRARADPLSKSAAIRRDGEQHVLARTR